MKRMHKIFRNYRNKNFPGRRKIQMSFYEGFRMFTIRLGNGVYPITEDKNISNIKKYWIVLDFR
jgi:hypothetical protein